MGDADRHRDIFYERLATKCCIQSPGSSEDKEGKEHGRVEHVGSVAAEGKLSQRRRLVVLFEKPSYVGRDVRLSNEMHLCVGGASWRTHPLRALFAQICQIRTGLLASNSWCISDSDTTRL